MSSMRKYHKHFNKQKHILNYQKILPTLFWFLSVLMVLKSRDVTSVDSVNSSIGLGHVPSTSKYRPSTIIRARSLETSKPVSSSRPPARRDSEGWGEGTRERDRETPQEAASRLNRSSSTLVLSDPSPSECGIGVSLQGVSPQSTLSSPTFSLAGLPQGPGPLHIASK